MKKPIYIFFFLFLISCNESLKVDFKKDYEAFDYYNCLILKNYTINQNLTIYNSLCKNSSIDSIPELKKFANKHKIIIISIYINGDIMYVKNRNFFKNEVLIYRTSKQAFSNFEKFESISHRWYYKVVELID